MGYQTIQLDMESIHEDVVGQIVAEADVRETDVESYIRDHISEELPVDELKQMVAELEMETFANETAELKSEIKALNERLEIQGETILILQEMALKQSKRRRWFG